MSFLFPISSFPASVQGVAVRFARCCGIFPAAVAPVRASGAVPGGRLSARRAAGTVVRVVAVTGLVLGAAAAQAHLGYTQRDFGTLQPGQSLTIANQAVPGNFGWADAADLALRFDPAAQPAADAPSAPPPGQDTRPLGDSHKARPFRLRLDAPQTVTITVQARADATATSVGGLLPGLSVYRGLAAVAPFAGAQTSADHDGAPASLAWRAAWVQARHGAGLDAQATAGCWNARGDWSIGGDGDVPGDAAALSTLRHVGSAWDERREGRVTLRLALPAGDYTLMVGGSDIASLGTPDGARAYGVAVTVESAR